MPLESSRRENGIIHFRGHHPPRPLQGASRTGASSHLAVLLYMVITLRQGLPSREIHHARCRVFQGFSFVGGARPAHLVVFLFDVGTVALGLVPLSFSCAAAPKCQSGPKSLRVPLRNVHVAPVLPCALSRLMPHPPPHPRRAAGAPFLTMPHRASPSPPANKKNK